MNAYEYALSNWETPSLKDAAEICRDFKQLDLLDRCLNAKRHYAELMETFMYSQNDTQWLDYASIWGSWYLEKLEQLEGMK